VITTCHVKMAEIGKKIKEAAGPSQHLPT
jgi:hypothetical protein